LTNIATFVHHRIQTQRKPLIWIHSFDINADRK
jgi:hypothetical protein